MVQTQVYAALDSGATEEVRKVIAANLGHKLSAGLAGTGAIHARTSTATATTASNSAEPKPVNPGTSAAAAPVVAKPDAVARARVQTPSAITN